MKGERGGLDKGRKTRLGQQSRMENDATVATQLPPVNTDSTVHHARLWGISAWPRVSVQENPAQG
jgi:hypothetical protein